MSLVASLALWEVIRELGQRQVNFTVLQPREELNELLLEARQGKSVGAHSGISGNNSTAATTNRIPKPKASSPKPFSETPVPPPSPPPPPPPPPTTTTPSERESRSLPPPALAAATVPVFTSIADALAWACTLSAEEILVELDFLHIEEGAEGGREGLRHAELARLLARAVLVERASGGGKEEGMPGKATLPIAMTGSSVAADAGASQKTKGVVRPLPSLVANAKSKARQRRLLEQQQQQQHLHGDGAGKVGVTEDEEGGIRGGGREGHVLDLEHAQEELAALRRRALETAASLDSTGSSSSSTKGATRGRIPSSSSSSASFPSSSSSSRRPPHISKKTNKGNKYSSRGASLFNDAYDQVKFSEGGDLALRVFEKMNRGTDKARYWATYAKGMARDAIIAASLNEQDADRRTHQKKSGKTSALQQKSRKLLGPRGRGWSKLMGHVTRAWAESAWQVVMALASWAGGGLLPGRYVLLGAGVFAMLLRQGVGTFFAALLVVRTCSSTLRNMIEDDEDEGMEGAMGVGF
ncbi:Hypothetical protein NocV09_00401600 [Nannochloropsis oceanica]